MNRKRYERYYSYGAYACGRYPQTHVLHQTRYANFQRFLDANTGIVPVLAENICCQNFILLSGRYRCDTPACYTNSIHIDIDIEDPQTGFRVSMHSDVFDHSHAMRLKGVRKSYFAVTHPYNFDSEKVSDYPKGLLQGLVAKVYPTEKDWYFPGQSDLVLIGTLETLALLDLSVLDTPIAEIVGALQGKQI